MDKKISNLVLLSILTFIFCRSTILQAQKPAAGTDGLEIHRTVPPADYITVYGKADRNSGVIRYIYNEDFKTTRQTPQAVASEYLLAQAERFGISSLQQELRLVRQVKSPAGHHLIYQQQYQGIPVYNSGIAVTIDKQGAVSFTSSTFQPRMRVKNLRAVISASESIQIAGAYLDGNNSISGESKTELMLFCTTAATGILVYRVQIIVLDPRGDWELLVDAGDGKVWQARNVLRFQTGSDGRGLLWDPDPLSRAGVYYGGFFIDNNDADAAVLNVQRESVVLHDLKYENGKFHLNGPYVRLVDIDKNPADVFPALSDSSGFNFTRQQQEFEDVMVYYNLDRAGRYLNYLGFQIDSLLAFRADPHGFNGLDNSYYSPFQNNCVFGEGGVDDGEDADVIWHEYAHALMAQIHYPQLMNYEGETAALEEGSADYWAASNSRSVSDFAWGQMFLWDAGIGSAPEYAGTFWPGRRCDRNWHYPEDYDFNAAQGHNNGQIWSSALMHIWSDLGREITDRLFVQAIYLWGTSPDLHDAAQAFVQADQQLYGGQHLADIVYWFNYHGLIDAGQTFPLIRHEPLADNEDLAGPYAVRVEIIPATAPLDTAGLWVVWGYSGVFLDSVPLIPTAELNFYEALIPGAGQPATINYYIVVTDSADYLATDPGRAPLEYYTFHTGPDIQAPLVIHAPLPDQSYWRWPAALHVYSTDNLGVEAVRVYYSLNQSEVLYSTQLVPAQVSGWYSGNFNLDTSQVDAGDSVHYTIQVWDTSIARNSTVVPPDGYYSFAIIAGGGEIVFDFEADDEGAEAQGDWEWGKPASGPRAAFGGERLWATKLDGNYSNGPLLSTLILPDINLRGFNVAALSSWQWYDIKSPGDGGNVKISADAGVNWQILQPLYGYDGILDTLAGIPPAGEEVFSGRSTGWVKTYFNLDSYVNQTVRIKFEFGADDAETGFGWYLDSVAVVEISARLNAPANLKVLDDHDLIKLGWEYSQTLKTKAELSGLGRGVSYPEDNTIFSSAELIFQVYRQVDSLNFNLIGQTDQYVFTDSVVGSGHWYSYYLTAQLGTAQSDPSDTIKAKVQAVIGITAGINEPQVYALRQNYPNPFNPVTVIQYQLPLPDRVKLTVYDIMGREVMVLVNEEQKAGYYQLEFNAGHLASGIYIYRLQTGQFVSTKKMVVIR